jgi:D-alanine-D-alanine ligase-like ATP-grasp enzyme
MMRITLLFGGTNKERLVSVASAQALHSALPEAELWFWDVDDTVHETRSEALLKHSRPFEEPFRPGTPSIGMIEQALDKAKAESRLLVLGLHGGMAEDGELQAMCEMRGIPFTGSGSASSHLAFDKVAAKRFAAIAGVQAPAGVALEDLEQALAEYGRLIAKPARDGSSYGLIFVNAKQDLAAVRQNRRICGRTVHRRRRGHLRRAGATGWLADRASAGGDHPGGGPVRLCRQVSRQSDPGDLPWSFCSRNHRTTQGPGAQGAPGVVVQRLYPH